MATFGPRRKEQKKKPPLWTHHKEKINWLTTIKMQLILHSFKTMNSENFQEARMEIKTYFKRWLFQHYSLNSYTVVSNILNTNWDLLNRFWDFDAHWTANLAQSLCKIFRISTVPAAVYKKPAVQIYSALKWISSHFPWPISSLWIIRKLKAKWKITLNHELWIEIKLYLENFLTAKNNSNS